LLLVLGGTVLPGSVASAVATRSVLTIGSVSPAPFYPRVRDGWRDEIKVGYRIKRCAGCDVVVRQRVLTAHGFVLFSKNRAIPTKATGPFAFRWNGRRGSGALVKPGNYMFELCIAARGNCDRAWGRAATGTQARWVGAGAVLSTAGTGILLGGKPFVPVGFSLIGTLAPPGCRGPATVAARHFEESVGIARAWGANTLRLQVSQEGLTGAAQAVYLDQVKAAVAMARGKGFAVIISLQDQWRACGRNHELPSAQSLAAWTKLAPVFGTDHAVMFELFNEPRSCMSSACWAQWRNGGSTPLKNHGDPAVGHQGLVEAIRHVTRNVIVADGAYWSFTLRGLSRPLVGTNIAYAWHPFYYRQASNWDARAGFVQRALHVPLLASEWNPSSNTGGNYPWCGTKARTMANRLVGWLSSRHVGIVFQGLDQPKETSLVWDWGEITACGTPHPASGYFARAWMGARSIAF
jgi:hypothetical protein